MAVEYKLNMEVTCDTCSQKHFFELHAGTGSFLDQEIDVAQELVELQFTHGWELEGSPYQGWTAKCPICRKTESEVRLTVSKAHLVS